MANAKPTVPIKLPCKVELGAHATYFHDMHSRVTLRPGEIVEITEDNMTPHTRTWIREGGLRVVAEDTPLKSITHNPDSVEAPTSNPPADKPTGGAGKPPKVSAKGKSEKAKAVAPSANQPESTETETGETDIDKMLSTE